jgi:heme-degrading monooxygenase HmoA
MPGYHGYLGHELLVDADDPGHLLVMSRWASREHADETLRQYADHPNARAANRLVAEPRRRIVAVSAATPQ